MTPARTAALAAAALVLLGSSGARDPLEIRGVDSGRTEDGHPWVHVAFAGEFPPSGLHAWYAAVSVRTSDGSFQYAVQHHAGATSRTFRDADGPRSGEVREEALGEGGWIVVLPLRARKGDRFLVQTAVQEAAGGPIRRHHRGTESRPLRIDAVVGDPVSLLAPGPSPTPSPSPAPAPGATPDVARAPPPVAADERGGAASASWVALAALLGLAAAVVSSPQGRPFAPVAAAIMAAGVGIGLLAGLAGPLGIVPGTVIGAGAAAALVVIAGLRRRPV